MVKTLSNSLAKMRLDMYTKTNWLSLMMYISLVTTWKHYIEIKVIAVLSGTNIIPNQIANKLQIAI